MSEQLRPGDIVRPVDRPELVGVIHGVMAASVANPYYGEWSNGNTFTGLERDQLEFIMRPTRNDDISRAASEAVWWRMTFLVRLVPGSFIPTPGTSLAGRCFRITDLDANKSSAEDMVDLWLKHISPAIFDDPVRLRAALVKLLGRFGEVKP